MSPIFAFKFPACRHFEFLCRQTVAALLRSNFLLFETIGQQFDVIKIQNGGAREI